MWQIFKEKWAGAPVFFNDRMGKRFLAYHRRDQISNSRIASVLIMILMPAGSLLDYFVYPEHFWDFFILRIISSILAAGCYGLLRLPRFSRRFYKYLSFSWFCIPTASISLMILWADGAASPYYAGLNLILVTVCWVAQVTFGESLISFATTITLYLMACLMHGIMELPLFFNNMYFIALTGVTMVIGNYVLNRLRLREFNNQVALDVSRKQLEEKNKQLHDMDAAKSQFFANISHELRTPLTLIIAPIEQLQKRQNDTEDSEVLQMMQRNASRLLRLIDELLALAKSQADQTLIYPKKVNGVALLEGIAGSVKSFATAKKINIEVRVPDKPVWFLVDVAKCEKILLNLIFNALKFIEGSGNVTLELYREPDMVCFRVGDDGPGIAGDHLKHLFDPFWQADGGSTRKHQGAGLGLALVKQWVNAHGGFVDVESKLGIGSVFTVRFPLPTEDDLKTMTGQAEVGLSGSFKRLGEEVPELLPSKHSLPAPSESYAADVQDRGIPSNATMLIADDEPEMRGYLAKQLSKSYHVKEAGTGLEAVEKAKKYLPDLILLDYMMPDLNGLEVCRLLKSDDTTAFIPIILLTARADQETKLEVLSAGATDFLTKPFGYEELHNRCTNLIELRQAQVTAAQKQDEAETALKQLKEAEAQLVQSAKVASLGQLSAGLLHEVNNPITFSLGAAKALKGLDTEEREGEDYAEILQDLSTGLNRAKNILLGLKRFCHPNQEGKDRVTLSAIFEECEVFVKVSLREHGVELSFQDTTNKELYLNRNQFVHMFINMIQNAIDSLAEKSEKIGKDWKPFIKITSKLTESGGIIIRFEDNGMGMSDEVSSKVLDPFYTTKPVGVGVGLGLSIVHRMVLNHDGIISIDSKPEEKCIFSMEFPNEICSVEI